MSKTIYITPGPTQTFPGFEDFLQDAISNDVCSISHRSPAYVDIHKKAVENLQEIANLPAGFETYFLGSATESWERIFSNCVSKTSTHFVNGSFSKKFHQYGLAENVDAQKIEVDFGKGFDKAHQELIKPNSELIALTHNETSSGVQTNEQFIHQVADKNPKSLIAVDMVSSFPYPQLDFKKVDTALFSVQKCMGLPAGLGVWFVNDKCREKYEELTSAGHSAGSHHTIKELSGKAQGFQTPSTPNVLGIYLLSRVTEVMLKKGIENIRKETEEKYAFLSESVKNIDFLDFAVENEEHRSRTVVVAKTSITPKDINAKLASKDLFIGAGYGNHKTDQIRIANFPAIDLKTMEKLVSQLKAL